jgi:hypothetical protein
MTLKETVLYELETADDLLLEDLLQIIRRHRLSGRESRKHNPSTPPASSEPIRRGGKLGDLLEFAGTWAGDDLQDCIDAVYATRSQASISTNSTPFQ